MTEFVFEHERRYSKTVWLNSIPPKHTGYTSLEQQYKKVSEFPLLGELSL